MNRLMAFLMGFALALPLLLPDRQEMPERGPVAGAAALPGGGVAGIKATPEWMGLDGLVKATPVSAARLGDQQHCLAQAVYFEARSETTRGQLAVAQVVLNRVESRRYPSTICGVVFQNERLRHRCQFSFACDGRSDIPHEARAWETAQRISTIALKHGWRDITDRATHYHADYANPSWRRGMEQTAAFGRHLFYRELG